MSTTTVTSTLRIDGADGPTPTLAVSGDCDIATVSRFSEQILDHLAVHPLAPGSTLVIDLTRVDFIDSTGVGMLVRTRRRAIAAGASVELVITPGSTASSLLAITGLAQAFTINVA